jgi:hypothetical protein
VLVAAACSGGPPGAAAGRPANAPDFASSATAPDEGTVAPVAQPPKKPLRIAVLGLENNPFWIPSRRAPSGRGASWRRATRPWSGSCRRRAHRRGVRPRHRRRGGQAVRRHRDRGGDAGVAAYIDRAVRAGVPVATFNSETNTPNGRLFFVGADSYAQGRTAGETMCRLTGAAGRWG